MASPHQISESSCKIPIAAEDERLQRAQWLRAAILGANDGLLSTTLLMVGIGAVKEDRGSMILSGLAGALAGACSMAVGEYVSVSTQRDIERSTRTSTISKLNVNSPDCSRTATVNKERMNRQVGDTASLENINIHNQHCSKLIIISADHVGVGVGVSPLARPAGCSSSSPYTNKILEEEQEDEEDKQSSRSKVVVLPEVVEEDNIIDGEGYQREVLTNPYKAAAASALAFLCGSFVPLLSALFVAQNLLRSVVIAVVTSVALACFGGLGAYLGGSPIRASAVRVLVGGWIAMAITYGLLKPFDTTTSS